MADILTRHPNHTIVKNVNKDSLEFSSVFIESCSCPMCRSCHQKCTNHKDIDYSPGLPSLLDLVTHSEDKIEDMVSRKKPLLFL